MDMKQIETHGILHFEPLAGSDGWYWGCDYCSGDLYEAEELFRLGKPIQKNRVIFLRHPDGRTAEPVKPRPGQYLGFPVWHDGGIVSLLVDFPKEEIRVIRYEPKTDILSTVVVLPLSAVRDCYNLRLEYEPFMLIRQGGEGRFEIIWPRKVSFPIGTTESFLFGRGNALYFQAWHEDPDYREEVLLRDSRTGAIRDRFPGSVKEMPDGQKWLLV